MKLLCHIPNDANRIRLDHKAKRHDLCRFLGEPCFLIREGRQMLKAFANVVFLGGECNAVLRSARISFD